MKNKGIVVLFKGPVRSGSVVLSALKIYFGSLPQRIYDVKDKNKGRLGTGDYNVKPKE